MSVEVARWVVYALAAYLMLGGAFAVPFLLCGITSIDPAAKQSSRGFRWIILPGVIALWPVLARAWMRGGPPLEATAHRRAARGSRAR